jgi:4-hydroxy-tetrahydrodipicolinate synthase
MERLSRIPTVLGVKESSGDIGQIGDIIREVAQARAAEGRFFSVLSGDDSYTLPLCAMGGDGIVSVVSNLVPARVAALAAACLSGDFAEARELHYALLPFFKGAFVETNPIPIKTAMSWAGLASGPTRLPLCGLEKASEPKLRASLEAAGIKIH